MRGDRQGVDAAGPMGTRGVYPRMWCLVALAVAVCRMAAGAGTDGEPRVFADEHLDLGVEYTAGLEHPLRVIWKDDEAIPPRLYPVTNAIVRVPESARRELPADVPPVGLPGDVVWLLPASQVEGVPFPGFSAEGLASAGLTGNVSFRLVGMEGPGHFFLWQTSVGALTFWMNTRDGFGPDDRFEQLLGGHSHANWGFTRPGVYRLFVEASARLAGSSTNITSVPTPVMFHVHPLPEHEPTPFERWQTGAWPGETEASRIGELADPDADGRVNLIEYAQGTDPNSPEAAPTSWLTPVLSRQGDLVRAGIRFRRPSTAIDLDASLVKAEQVGGPWMALDQAGPSESATDGDAVVVTLWDPTDAASRTSGWYRLALRLKSGFTP